jgi:lipopolysaccharide transport system permease protein
MANGGPSLVQLGEEFIGVGEAAITGGPCRAESVRRRERAIMAWADLRDTLLGWRLWFALGTNDIRQRYRRSKLGQFWITVSMAVFIVTIGSVYALLFRVDIREQLPHVVVFYSAWSFMSACMNEGAGAFTEAERYLRQERLPKLTFVARVVWRNLLAYLHNLVLVPVTFLIFSIGIGLGAIAAVIGVVFMIVNVCLVVVILSVLCTRFRDLRQVVSNVIQIAFFISPIMWQPSVMPAAARLLVEFNPVAAHLRLIGDPLLGQSFPYYLYLICGGCTLVLFIVAAPLFVRFRERIVYWL